MQNSDTIPRCRIFPTENVSKKEGALRSTIPRSRIFPTEYVV